VAESGWQVGNGESNGFKSITAFYPTEVSNSNGIVLSVCFFSICASDICLFSHYNFYCVKFLLTKLASVSVAITGLGPDFTRMESFGKVDEFAQTLV